MHICYVFVTEIKKIVALETETSLLRTLFAYIWDNRNAESNKTSEELIASVNEMFHNKVVSEKLDQLDAEIQGIDENFGDFLKDLLS